MCVLVAGGSVAQAGARQDQGSLTAEGRVTGGGGGKEGVSDQHPTDTGTCHHRHLLLSL